MRSSDENRKSRAFSLPRQKKVVAKTWEYPKRTLVDRLFSPRTPIGTLTEGVGQAFVEASPRRLEKWKLKCEKAFSDPELILFATLLCGCHFRIIQPDVSSVLGQLWTWLTQHPRSMNDELAGLLIESLAPALKKSLEERGQQKGWPGGTFEKERGRPPKARGALAALVIAQCLLSQKGAKKGIALDLATDLGSILLGRQRVERLELYRFRKRIPPQTLTSICEQIVNQYEWLLIQDGVRTRDSKPEGESQEQYAEWRRRHKDLTETLHSFGWEPLAERVLHNIPAELWQPFWQQDSKVARSH